MTVHASKGLEYPVIVLVDSTWTRKGGGADPVVLRDARYGLTCKVFDENSGRLSKPYSYQRIDYLQDLRETAERKRLLYVAATRAQDYLLVSGQRGKTVTGWLAWLDRALQAGILDQTATSDGVVCTYPWGQARWTKACAPPSDELLGADQADGSSWDKPLSVDTSLSIEPPMLVGAIRVERTAPTRHLSATQIADLGGAVYGADHEERFLYRDRFRRKALYDAPATIASVSAHRPQQATGGQIGEIVHEALRYWRFPGEHDNLEDLLRSYAWKHGIISEEYREEAVVRARKLLMRFVGSDVYQWVNSAREAGRPVLTELPFIYRTDNRILHGVIDLLFQRENGNWLVVDYKTSYMREKSEPTPQQIAEHARRYHLQVGVYGAAVQEHLGGIVPETHIHYIRYTHTVHVTTDEWREALANLETLIGRVVGDDEEGV
jgi:ATP-dependent helicase/nuclease subunit A